MSKKHPTSSRAHHDSDVPDDAFVGTIRRIITWGQENSRQVTIAAAAVVVVAGFATWMIVQQRSVEAQAQARLTQVQQSVASGNTELAIRDLQSFLDTFGSTKAADQARLVLADILISQDRAEEAIEDLGDLPDRLDAPFGLAAARLRASALEDLTRYDDAVEAYQEIAENARFTYQKREALADAARVQLQQGHAAAAADLYQQVVDTFETDESGRAYYEMWLAQAQAQARGGPEQGAAAPQSPGAAAAQPEAAASDSASG